MLCTVFLVFDDLVALSHRLLLSLSVNLDLLSPTLTNPSRPSTRSFLPNVPSFEHPASLTLSAFHRASTACSGSRATEIDQVTAASDQSRSEPALILSAIESRSTGLGGRMCAMVLLLLLVKEA
jgi:hypothetical protein